MFQKYVMRNRSLAAWLAGATLLSSNGCDIAASILNIVAGGLRFFS
jgi:hypothetical protein